MPGHGRSPLPAAAIATHVAIGLIGLFPIALAFAAGQGWFERHFLPSFGQTRAFQWNMVQAFRLLLGAAGLALLLLVRSWALRAVFRGEGRRALVSALSILLAVAASLTATELVLRTRTWRATQENAPRKEPVRRHDALLGWDLAPGQTRRVEIDGRAVDYAIDATGYRAVSPASRIDFTRPTLIFAGESIMFGYGLNWRDTIPARVEAALGVQTANLAVPAFGTDQSLLRLRRELPRFARPAAVIILFTPFLLDRNLDRDRPHLDPRLGWHAAEPPRLRLVELGRRLVRYRGDAAIADGVTMTEHRAPRRSSSCPNCCPRIRANGPSASGFWTKAVSPICWCRSTQAGGSRSIAIPTPAAPPPSPPPSRQCCVRPWRLGPRANHVRRH
jgi:hypothetical protein